MVFLAGMLVRLNLPEASLVSWVSSKVTSTSFDNVPADASHLSIEFDCYEIDDWKDANHGGTDCFYAWIGGEKLASGSQNAEFHEILH
jgi:hypothetical protein